MNADFAAKNALIFGVSFDSIEENRAFAEKFSFNFPLLCDTDRSMGLAYGACTDSNASNAARIGVVIGPDGNIREYESSVNPRGYPAEVLQRL